jgi:hypothetical protein
MSTLTEIEEAIKTLPPDQIAELACWLDDIQSVNGPAATHSDECLKAQIESARRRMEAMDAGTTTEIQGETAHATVRKFIAREP